AGARKGGEDPDAGPVPVTVVEATHQDVPVYASALGTVTAMNTVTVSPQVGGQLMSLNFREGQEVKKGEVLFTIDARSYQAEYDRAAAELARARTQATLARSESERAKRLSEQQAISTETAEQRRAAADQSGAAVQAAQAALDAARLNLEFTKVRAPIDGRAGRAMVTAGNLVTAGDSASV
ncbi:efflux RND transporter periplasmic adaptor subunit, partial [Enterobacter hormaechei]|uniref:efflux RND transporter periplasmic adaptor subunit n=1 Tax=Enterobacter hormaechei TaxID=158836 RepID=UPI00200E5DDF